MKTIMELELEEMNLLVLAIGALIDEGNLNLEEQRVVLGLVRKFKATTIEFLRWKYDQH